MMRRVAALFTPHLRTDGGYSTEAVVVTALLALLAVGAVAVISDAVMERVDEITLE
ncbi:hypothetical protein FHX37_2642 [Haloactinospora alba]|uniref:Uncharacterized protein n=1 Tax=Haloactinospora alba TaxID=405555 RepID=A0A543NLE1_9ACTN|nr:hypothetical protein [Haloactinospora alba]TQN32665.1 hypothetical protein FHX37_2642 [Haloactinospora alba]